jgi:hypothetical protein
MKAEIKASGNLVIKAENELEAYALKKWAEDNLLKDKKINIMVDISFPDRNITELYEKEN